MPAVTHNFADLDTVRLHYVTAGAGDTRSGSALRQAICNPVIGEVHH
jgi:hypothetical protein